MQATAIPTAASAGVESWKQRARTTRAWGGLGWILFGNIVYAVSQYGIVVALARVTTPRLVGQYALALAITGPAMFFCNLQLRAILASDAGRSHRFDEYWRIRIFTVPLAWAMVATAVLIGRFETETSIVILMVGAAKSVETLADLCFGASQRNNRLDLVGKSLAMKGPLSLLLLGAIAWGTQSLAAAMAAVGLVWFLLLYFYDLPNAERGEAAHAKPPSGKHAVDWKRQWQLVAVGLPLAVSIALLTLTVALPNILVERYLGEGEVGIYAALASMAWAAIPLINALGQTAMPKFGALSVAGDYSRLRTTVMLLAALGGAVGLAGYLGAWLCGEAIVRCFFGPTYSGRIDVLMWLMLAAAFLFASRFVADALTAMRCVRVQLLTQAATLLVVLAGGIAVVPTSGLVGLAKVLAAALALRWLALTVGFLRESRGKRPDACSLAASRDGRYSPAIARGPASLN